jgi:hypothetical protein
MKVQTPRALCGVALGGSVPPFLSLSRTDLVPIYRRLLEIDDGYGQCRGGEEQGQEE